MPERKCGGCTRQVDWGCEAEKVVSGPDDPTAEQDKDGVWWGWLKPAHLPMTVDGEQSYACPRQDLKRRPQEWHVMLLYYGMYKKGHLPQAGAVMDQSNKAIELFRVLDDVNAECDAAQLEELRRTQAQPQPQQAGKPNVRRR